jgi:lysophospholipase L1-like esterase
VFPKVRARAGIPRFAARLRRGEPVTVVAFGTSMTAYGEYLHHAADALRAVPGAGSVTFVNAGMRGYVTLNAPFRVRDAVVAHAPDLVLIEFAHNDTAPLALEAIRSVLLGMMAQLWSAGPCEFAFVYLAPRDRAADGPTEAMVRYEAVADEFGIASIDCATFVEGLVRAGTVTWTDGARALTRDGTHYAEIARDAVGRPFAAALVALVDASSGPERDTIPPLVSPFAHTALRPAHAFAEAGEAWAVCPPLDHAGRIAEAYADERVLANLVAGASFRIPLAGTLLFGWISGTGTVDITGTPPFLPISYDFDNPTFWRSCLFAAAGSTTRGEVIVTVRAGTAIFGDLNVAGDFR